MTSFVVYVCGSLLPDCHTSNKKTQHCKILGKLFNRVKLPSKINFFQTQLCPHGPQVRVFNEYRQGPNSVPYYSYSENSAYAQM